MALVPLSRKGARGPSRPDTSAYLPTTREEMDARGWDELDVLIVNGDAYIDHPAFGGALIGRFLEGRGYRVGMVAQPKWDDISDVSRMGAPRLFVGITSGNLDSMLNKLTAQKKVRSEDQYSPGGRTNMRPIGQASSTATSAGRRFRACRSSSWHRSLAPAHRPLRLLERFDSSKRLARFQGRHAHLWHGRTPCLGSRRPTRCRRNRARPAQVARYGRRARQGAVGRHRTKSLHPRSESQSSCPATKRSRRAKNASAK